MRYNFTEIANEDDGLLPVPSNGQSMYTIVNKDQKNKWGVPRGYRIVPGLSNVHLASMNSPFFLKSGQYAKQAFAVSKQKDSEPSSSAALNQNIPEAPLVEFYKFFDGESLVQEDIVAWVNLGMSLSAAGLPLFIRFDVEVQHNPSTITLTHPFYSGMHHYTRSEDIPNTLMSEAHSSIMFAPQNWGTTEATVDLTNAVIFNAPETATNEEPVPVAPNTNGVNPPSCFGMSPEDELLGVFEA